PYTQGVGRYPKDSDKNRKSECRRTKKVRPENPDRTPGNLYESLAAEVSRTLRVLLHLLELDVLRLRAVAAIRRAAGIGLRLRLAGIGPGLCALRLLLCVDVLRCSLPCGVQLGDGRVDSRHVGVL